MACASVGGAEHRGGRGLPGRGRGLTWRKRGWRLSRSSCSTTLSLVVRKAPLCRRRLSATARSTWLGRGGAQDEPFPPPPGMGVLNSSGLHIVPPMAVIATHGSYPPPMAPTPPPIAHISPMPPYGSHTPPPWLLSPPFPPPSPRLLSPPMHPIPPPYLPYPPHSPYLSSP